MYQFFLIVSSLQYEYQSIYLLYIRVMVSTTKEMYQETLVISMHTLWNIVYKLYSQTNQIPIILCSSVFQPSFPSQLLHSPNFLLLLISTCLLTILLHLLYCEKEKYINFQIKPTLSNEHDYGSVYCLSVAYCQILSWIRSAKSVRFY